MVAVNRRSLSILQRSRPLEICAIFSVAMTPRFSSGCSWALSRHHRHCVLKVQENTGIFLVLLSTVATVAAAARACKALRKSEDSDETTAFAEDRFAWGHPPP